jgi:hypothetical protein
LHQPWSRFLSCTLSLSLSHTLTWSVYGFLRNNFFWSSYRLNGDKY